MKAHSKTRVSPHALVALLAATVVLFTACGEDKNKNKKDSLRRSSPTGSNAKNGAKTATPLVDPKTGKVLNTDPALVEKVAASYCRITDDAALTVEQRDQPYCSGVKVKVTAAGQIAWDGKHSQINIARVKLTEKNATTDGKRVIVSHILAEKIELEAAKTAGAVSLPTKLEDSAAGDYTVHLTFELPHAAALIDLSTLTVHLSSHGPKGLTAIAADKVRKFESQDKAAGLFLRLEEPTGYLTEIRQDVLIEYQLK